MDDQEQAREIAVRLLTVSEALQITMPRVSNLLDFAVDLIEDLIRRAYKEGRGITTDTTKLVDALRVCGCGDKPCGDCPYHAELDPFNCQKQIMEKAADLIEQLEEEET